MLLGAVTVTVKGRLCSVSPSPNVSVTTRECGPFARGLTYDTENSRSCAELVPSGVGLPSAVSV